MPIQINTKLPTKVEVDLGVKGNTKPPVLRMLFHTTTFFIGFEGDRTTIEIPPLSEIGWSSSQVQGKLEAIIDEYHLILWEDTIDLVEVAAMQEAQNVIKIKIKLVERDTTPPEPEITVRLKS